MSEIRQLGGTPKLPLDLPEKILFKRSQVLSKLGVDPNDTRSICQSIMRLSDYYVRHPEKSSPWHEAWVQIAYISYYMPLNWWRLCGVLHRASELNFFQGLDHAVDFGSGLGSFGMALDELAITFKSILCVEKSLEARSIHKQLLEGCVTTTTWESTMSPDRIQGNTMAVFSYSLTELPQLPKWVDRCEALLIVEPSTQSDSRRLINLRQELLNEGWHVWGPCAHGFACPLLVNSDRDWCHDRFQWTQPEWMRQLEQHLPIKNGTLPCSWLLMRRSPPPPHTKGVARITGDLQAFKGFAKQLVCRGPSREFLSWQKKDWGKAYPEIPRGSLVQIVGDPDTKGNEVRIKP